MAVPLIGGWALQELVAAWGHLLPAVGPADMAAKARQRDVLSRLALPRVLAWNLGVALAWAGLGLGIPVAIGLGAVLLGGAVVTALVLLAMALLIGRTRASVQP
jgi:hypothetical protein